MILGIKLTALSALLIRVFPNKLDPGFCRLDLHLTVYMRSRWILEGARIEMVWDISG